MAGILRPTYRSGFASPQRGDMRYPQLWRGCVGAFAAGLGSTGSNIFDHSYRNSHAAIGAINPATDWAVKEGFASVYVAAFIRPATPIPFAANSAVSAAFWIYPTTWSGANPGFMRSDAGAGGDFFIFQGSTGRPWIRRNGVDVLKPASGASVSLNVWQHLAFTVDQVSSKFYINGTLVHSGSGGSCSAHTMTTICEQRLSERVFGHYDAISIHAYTILPGEIALLSRRPGIAYETMPTRYQTSVVGAGPPATFTGRNMLVGCAF